MDWNINPLNFIVQSILQEIIVVIAGVIFAHFILDIWGDWRYGRWHVVINQGGRQILDRKISPDKVKEILKEPADRSVFLKGVASPYAWINCDLIEDGERLGLLVEDHENRCFTLNLDKNPEKSASTRAG